MKNEYVNLVEKTLYVSEEETLDQKIDNLDKEYDKHKTEHETGFFSYMTGKLFGKKAQNGFEAFADTISDALDKLSPERRFGTQGDSEEMQQTKEQMIDILKDLKTKIKVLFSIKTKYKEREFKSGSDEKTQEKIDKVDEKLLPLITKYNEIVQKTYDDKSVVDALSIKDVDDEKLGTN